MDVTKNPTIRNALAYIAITGNKKGLHFSTRAQLGRDLVGFQCEDLNKPFYFVTEKGMQIARRSRLWKAHEALVERGFTVDGTARRRRPGYIPYYHRDDVRRAAFTGRHGRAYAEPARVDGKYRPCELVAEFRNG